MTNVKVREKKPFEQLDGVNQLVAEAEKELSAQGGRVLLRYSGTEPKVRLLVEGRDAQVAGNGPKKSAARSRNRLGFKQRSRRRLTGCQPISRLNCGLLPVAPVLLETEHIQEKTGAKKAGTEFPIPAYP